MQSTLDVNRTKNNTPVVDDNDRLKQHLTLFCDVCLCAEVCHENSNVREDLMRMGVCLQWVFVSEGTTVHAIRSLANADDMHTRNPDIDNYGVICELFL